MTGKLTEKRRRFVEAYTGEAMGNALEAARLAGYKSPHPEGARLLQNPTVSAAIREALAEVRSEAVATREERLAFYSRVMRGEETTVRYTLDGEPYDDPPAMKDRLKAAELLGKVEGDFIERVEVSTPRTREEALERIEAIRAKLGSGDG